MIVAGLSGEVESGAGHFVSRFAFRFDTCLMYLLLSLCILSSLQLTRDPLLLCSCRGLELSSIHCHLGLSPDELLPSVQYTLCSLCCLFQQDARGAALVVYDIQHPASPVDQESAQ